MKKTIFLFFLLSFVLTASAQLKVKSSGKVGINTGYNNLTPKLTVGNNPYATNNNTSIGIAASPEMTNGNNIAVEGAVLSNPSYSSSRNYGVLGIVSSMNLTHGRNYGVSGMIGPLGNHYGGAGVYGTCSSYFFPIPPTSKGNMPAILRVLYMLQAT